MKIILLTFLFSLNVFALETKTKEKLIDVYQKYEQVHSHFFKFDLDKSKKALKELSSSIDKIENEELKEKLVFTQKTIVEMLETDKRKELNKSLHTVSLALIHILQKYEVDSKYQPYSCPMVQMKWIQNVDVEAKVLNPYAPEMPHCGHKE